MIDILMAVYNGEKYLAEQIESIINQTYTNWRLIICDDNSKDRSFEIMTEYAEKYPDKIVCYKNEFPTGSAQGNFMNMLKYVKAEHIMFSDQDDFWLPGKIEKTLNKMKELEKECSDIPILVHSELAVTDSELNITHNSFTKYQGLNPKLTSLNRLLVQNNVTGCTVMINKSLYQLVKNVPAENMLMHDWWFALVASAFGKIGFIDEPLIKYRQHGNNQLGAVNNKSIKGVLKIISERTKSKKRVSYTYSHAKSFYLFYKNTFSEDNKAIIEKYLTIPRKNKLKRIFLLIKHNHLKQNFITAVGQLIFC